MVIRNDKGEIVRNEDGTPVGSVDVSALEAEDAAAEETEDLSSLLKADLVERAEAAGIDTNGLTKAELVDALEYGVEEEVTDGDDSVS